MTNKISGQIKWCKTPGSPWFGKNLAHNLKPKKQHAISKEGGKERLYIGNEGLE